MVNPTKQNAWERIAKLEAQVKEKDAQIKTLKEEVDELASQVDQDGYEVREMMARNGL